MLMEDGTMLDIYTKQQTLYTVGGATSHDCEYLIDGKWIHPKTLTTKGITSLHNGQKRTTYKRGLLHLNIDTFILLTRN